MNQDLQNLLSLESQQCLRNSVRTLESRVVKLNSTIRILKFILFVVILHGINTYFSNKTTLFRQLISYIRELDVRDMIDQDPLACSIIPLVVVFFGSVLGVCTVELLK